MPSIALFQPDIPQNVGAIIRIAACFGMKLQIIGPTGFVMDEKRLKRVAMDYSSAAEIVFHHSYEEFLNAREGDIVLLTTKAARPVSDYKFKQSDILMFGRESSGVPDYVHNDASQRLIIPMPGGARSLNIAVSVGIIAFCATQDKGVGVS